MRQAGVVFFGEIIKQYSENDSEGGELHDDKKFERGVLPLAVFRKILEKLVGLVSHDVHKEVKFASEQVLAQIFEEHPIIVSIFARSSVFIRKIFNEIIVTKKGKTALLRAQQMAESMKEETKAQGLTQ